MKYLDRAKFFLIPLCLILFCISVTLGLTRHNDKEKDYIELLSKICEYDSNQTLGKHTALNSPIIFVVIGGYIGLLFLKNKIEKENKNSSFSLFHKLQHWENILH